MTVTAGRAHAAVEQVATPAHYVARFRELADMLPGARSAEVRALREAAIARFAELGFPTPRLEDWKFTNVAPLARVPFRVAPAHGDGRRTENDRGRLEELLAATGAGDLPRRLVFVDGAYAPALSAIDDATVTARSLREVLEGDPARVTPYLGGVADVTHAAFAALNTAFFADGAFVEIPAGVVLGEPLALVHLSTAPAEPVAIQPRALIALGAGAQATIVECYAGLEGGVYFTNAVTEIALGPNAALDHYKVQREGSQAFHVSLVEMRQERDSRFTSHNVSLGGALVRNDVNTTLGAPGAECALNGLYIAGGRQHVDNHTSIDHAASHCTSRETYRGVLDDRARAVFNGKIVVRPDAQKTDARQTNKNLLLSDEATIDTKPQLEIFANDVKCTHGATVGQLEEDAVFYLRSRGIGRKEARSILTYAFVCDVLAEMSVESVRATLEQTVAAQLAPGDVS
jgi:Fe-S cluster assembly protein SufD